MKTIRNVIASIRAAYHKAFGQPVWVESRDGTLFETRVKRLNNGKVIMKDCWGDWVIAPPATSEDDTTKINRRTKQWWPK